MRGVWPERNDRDVEAIKCVWECGGKKGFLAGRQMKMIGTAWSAGYPDLFKWIIIRV